METIEVRYKALGPGYFHKYIVYTDKDGNQYATRGGPSKGDGIGDSSTAQSGSVTPGANNSPFGIIEIETDSYRPALKDDSGRIIRDGFSDYDHEGDDPAETIKSGDDLTGEWQRIKEAMGQIGELPRLPLFTWLRRPIRPVVHGCLDALGGEGSTLQPPCRPTAALWAPLLDFASVSPFTRRML